MTLGLLAKLIKLLLGGKPAAPVKPKTVKRIRRTIRKPRSRHQVGPCAFCIDPDRDLLAQIREARR